MIESIHPVFTWSQNRIFAGGNRNVILLVEWKGNMPSEHSRPSSYKVVAREIELRVWLEPHVTFKRSYGCEFEVGEGSSLLLKLGKIKTGQRKFIALEFNISTTIAGRYEALSLQWKYKKPTVERVQELPVKVLELEYTHHTQVLNETCCFHVEKHLELLKTAETIEEATTLQNEGQHSQAHEMLCRHADKLLLLAVRSGDPLLLKERSKCCINRLDSSIRSGVKLLLEIDIGHTTRRCILTKKDLYINLFCQRVRRKIIRRIVI